MRLKNILKIILPLSILNRLIYVRAQLPPMNLMRIKQSHKTRIKKIRKSNKARVIFLAGSLAMWRYQKIYEILSSDQRFEIIILICPPAMRKDNNTITELESYFNMLKMPFINAYNIDCNKYITEWDPDIIFYCQPYDSALGNAFDCEHNLRRLLCYVPYALLTVNKSFAYNCLLHNCAWRYYQATELHLRTSRQLSMNYGENIRVVGEPHADDFAKPVDYDPWIKHEDGKIRKRIIWAPHASIQKVSSLNRHGFLWLHNAMLHFAEKYKDSIQIAFKPHPYLKDSLREIWGETKTKEYYEKWERAENTQIETGEFIDLFKTSDALIHDCGSFTGEYIFTGKPVMFTTQDITELYNSADYFGIECLNCHYFGKNVAEVEKFIIDIINNAEDSLLEKRIYLKQRFLTPPKGQSVAKNVYEDIVHSIYGKY